jgi:hypothetical protein
MLGGFPIYLDPSGGFFSPIHLLLFRVFPVFDAYVAALMVGISAVFWCTYASARAISLSRAAALLSAIVYSFGYHMLTWSNNVWVVNAFFSLPFLFLSLTNISRGRLLWIVWGGIGVGFALFTGQPQWVLMSFVAGGLYLLYLLWQEHFAFSRRNIMLVIGFLLIGLIAWAVSAFQTIPTNRFTAFSSRAQGISWQEAQINAQTPLDFVRYIIPEFHIKDFTSAEPVLYIGIIPLLCAFFGYWHLRKRPDARFYALLFAFGLLTAVMYSPIFYLLHRLPYFEYFRGADRWLYVANFGLAILAGLGFDVLRSGELSQRVTGSVQAFARWLLISVGSIALLANVIYFVFGGSIINFLQSYFDKHLYARTTGLPLEHYHNVIRAYVVHIYGNFSITNWRFLFALIFLVVGVWFLGQIRERKPWMRRYLVYFIIASSAVNLIALNPNYSQTVSRAIIDSEPAFITAMKQNADYGQFRIFCLFGGSALDQKLRTPYQADFTADDVVQFDHDMVFTGLNMMYGVKGLDGFNNLMPRRNAKILGALGSETATVGPRLAYEDVPLEKKIQTVMQRMPLYSAMNVRYISSANLLPETNGLRLLTKISSTRFDIPLYLYENQNALPTVYLANEVIRFPENASGSYDSMLEPSQDFSDSTFVECDHCEAGGKAVKSDVIHVSSLDDGTAVIEASVRNPRWLVFSESRVPGWSATIDGKAVDTYYANYVFQAVLVPKGAHTVLFTYNGI